MRGANMDTSVLDFVVNGYAIKFGLQDKQDRIEERGEIFNKVSFTPPVPNGEPFRFGINNTPFQAQRQGLYGCWDEILNPMYNHLFAPYHPERPVNIGEWGWMDGSLIVTTDNATSTDISGVITHKGAVPVDMTISNPWTRNPDNKQKEYKVQSDFVKITKVTNRLYSATNDWTKDDKTGLPNASLKLYYRQQLNLGGFFEFYPVVKKGTSKAGELYWMRSLQLKVQDFYSGLLRIHEGEDVDFIAKLYYTKKSLRNEAYRKARAGIESGDIPEDVVIAVDATSRQYGKGEEVEPRERKVKVDGTEIDVTAVPLAVYSCMIDGNKEYFDTSLRDDRYNLEAAVQRLNGGLELHIEPDDFLFDND